DGFQTGWHAALERIRQGDGIDELSQLTPKPSPDSSKADAIQRVIEAAKDNHGDDCEAWRCLHCGRYCDVTSHRFTPRPCTCGLDAALSLLSVPEQKNDHGGRAICRKRTPNASRIHPNPRHKRSTAAPPSDPLPFSRINKSLLN